jgi:glucose-1-phosphatase
MRFNPSSVIRHPLSVKNIIFDFGGVICDLHIQRTIEKFKEFGPVKEDRAVSKEESDKAFGNLVEQLESGMISPSVFRQTIREHYIRPVSDEMIDDAWNALLGEIPEVRIRLLEHIRNYYRIFLLSNSNQIHYDFYVKRFTEKFGYPDFDGLFEKAWFSFRIGMKKPDPGIFEYVLAEKSLLPGETLFIDDTLMHVQAAELAGIQGYHLKPGETVTDLFSE